MSQEPNLFYLTKSHPLEVVRESSVKASSSCRQRVRLDSRSAARTLSFLTFAFLCSLFSALGDVWPVAALVCESGRRWGAGAVGSFPRASLLHLRYKFPGLVFGSQVPGESPVLPSPGGTDLQSLGDQLSFYRRGSETEGAM